MQYEKIGQSIVSQTANIFLILLLGKKLLSGEQREELEKKSKNFKKLLFLNQTQTNHTVCNHNLIRTNDFLIM
jgi:hypothetical protein